MIFNGFYKDKENNKLLQEPFEQFNINLIVGNGFDIEVLNHYNKGISTYGNFYNYEINFNGRNYKNNKILMYMHQNKNDDKNNWSDIESTIKELLNAENNKNCINNIVKDVDQIQEDFADFLNFIIKPSLLKKVYKDANLINKDKSNTLKYPNNIKSLSRFLYDTNEYYKNDNLNEIIHIMEYNGRVMNWSIFNLNYTSLLDNYLTTNFDSVDINKPNKSGDRNFIFSPSKNSNNQSDYLYINTIHPHGYVGIPDSMIIGTYEDNLSESSYDMKKLSKDYTAQYNLYYKDYIDKGSIFILYGVSLGESDTWWWKNIIKRMNYNIETKGDYGKIKPIVIIYQHYNHIKEDINNFIDKTKSKFLKFDTNKNVNKEKFKNQIIIIPFNNDKIYYPNNNNIYKEFLRIDN